MRNPFLLLVLAALVAGCEPASEPVAFRPTQPELFGNWILANSPTVSRGLAVPVPTKGNSSIILASNSLVKLKNVLVEELTVFPKGPPSGRMVTLKTGDATWEVEESQGLWSVMVYLPNQVIAFHIRQRSNGAFEFSYRPDPEKDAFIYTRDENAQGKR